MLNDFIVEPLKRRLPSDVTFITVLRHMCWTFSVRYNMYLSIFFVLHVFMFVCYLFIMLSNWDNTFQKLMDMLF